MKRCMASQNINIRLVQNFYHLINLDLHLRDFFLVVPHVTTNGGNIRKAVKVYSHMIDNLLGNTNRSNALGVEKCLHLLRVHKVMVSQDKEHSMPLKLLLKFTNVIFQPLHLENSFLYLIAHLNVVTIGKKISRMNHCVIAAVQARKPTMGITHMTEAHSKTPSYTI